ncbi:MAG: 3-dehydroquinate synthase [Chloroherpetonaceae bacterium]|nr:3-dehydroquinate synthase [Chloroherpetonaceae bacterium]MDW8466506.1 3-dehydroquinate synthase [Chloroherpetonaceae bacterium]
MSEVLISHRLASDLADICNKHQSAKRLVLCIDQHVDTYFGTPLCLELRKENFVVHKTLVPASERSKSLAMANRLYGEWVRAGVDRTYTVVAVGGGVVGDLAGFVAASYMRGLPLVHIPTTLLAMVDSAIGGKVAINHPAGKNLIGFFYEASATLIDPAFLRTLPPREIFSGLAEVLKYALIGDRTFFSFLEEQFEAIVAQRPPLVEAIKRCVAMKQRIVKLDFRETTGLRARLNFGHTFAHALEKLAHYRFLRHGEAVLFGMLCASALSMQLGLLAENEAKRIVQIAKRFNVKRTVAERYFLERSEKEIEQAMQSDKKKANGVLRFVLLRQIGEAFLSESPVQSHILQRAIKEAKQWWKER